MREAQSTTMLTCGLFEKRLAELDSDVSALKLRWRVREDQDDQLADATQKYVAAVKGSSVDSGGGGEGVGTGSTSIGMISAAGGPGLGQGQPSDVTRAAMTQLLTGAILSETSEMMKAVAVGETTDSTGTGASGGPNIPRKEVAGQGGLVDVLTAQIVESSQQGLLLRDLEDRMARQMATMRNEVGSSWVVDVDDCNCWMYVWHDDYPDSSLLIHPLTYPLLTSTLSCTLAPALLTLDRGLIPMLPLPLPCGTRSKLSYVRNGWQRPSKNEKKRKRERRCVNRSSDKWQR